MSKTYRLWNPNQQWLLPPSVHDWLPENDLVYFMLDTVNELDISAITAKYEQEERGCPPYNPRMMVARRKSRLKRVFVGLPGVLYLALTGKLAALEVLAGGFDAHACQVRRLVQVIYLVFHLEQSPYLSVCDHLKSLNLRKSDSLFSPATIRKL
jgi:hypothetical protein